MNQLERAALKRQMRVTKARRHAEQRRRGTMLRVECLHYCAKHYAIQQSRKLEWLHTVQKLNNVRKHLRQQETSVYDLMA